MEIKYSPNIYWKVLIISCSVLILVVFAPSLFINPPNLSNISDFIGVGVVVLIFVFMPLYATFGLYIKVGERKICRTDYFIWRKCIKIADINNIRSWPSWGIGQTLYSFEIISHTGWNKSIEFTSTAFTEETIAKLIINLKQKNPSINLDEYVETLVKKYG